MKSQVHFLGTIAYFPVDSDGIDSSHSKKMLGCFNPILGKIQMNPNIELKM